MLAYLRSVIRPVTVAELIQEYLASPAFLSLSASSQAPYRRVVNRLLREVGERSVRSLTRRDIEALLTARTPGAANDALKKIRILTRFAIERGYRHDDPAFGIRRFPAGAGHHTWTEAEIARYEARWPVGSRERLAFALLLYTGQRRSDVVRMRWDDLVAREQALCVAQRKTHAKLVIPVHPTLTMVLKAAERTPGAILHTPFDKAFTAAGFGNWMADRISEAELPDRCVTHGLRKAAARRLAEAGCSAKEIASITGHATLREVERYTQAADQVRLAGQAMARIARETCE